jgi:nicotinate-nucleotide adenylyltransferase
MYKRQKIKVQSVAFEAIIAARAAKTKHTLSGKRIGIYAGAFNPVHTGHITFALQAIEMAQLDQVVFLPERLPRHKPGVEHFGHRVAMLKRAIKPHPRMAVLEVVDKNFTVQRTWRQLQTIFGGAQLVLLIGSDAVISLPEWPQAKKLLQQSELVVGVRGTQQVTELEQALGTWPVQPQKLHLLQSFAPEITSTVIREAIGARKLTKGLLASVQQYARRNWLYVSMEHVVGKNI